ncbi:MAG: tetraacyldisaccharide 4'-kinase [Acidobacteriota bacterium]
MSAIFLYRVLQFLGIPLILVYFLRRGLKDRRYWQGFAERLGFLPASFRQTGHAAIWLHAVSVGEVLSSAGLVRELRARFPEEPLFVSCATIAGRAAAVEKLAGAVDGVFYAPLDFVFAVRRVLRTIRPRVLVVLETEIWPNLYREAKRAGVGLVIVNGRISDRAIPRYRKRRWFFRQVLAWPDAILAQSRVSRDRFLELGAPRERVQLAGNLKYDFDPRGMEPPAAVREFVERARPSAIWVAASTMPPAEAGDPDEDEAVIAAFREACAAHPGLLLMLVPRRPERFDTAAAALERAGVPFVRRTAIGIEIAPVLLVDSIGELGSLFQLADVVFMGGTLAHRGGHNILEPAFFGKPVIAGPHMENFPEIAEKFSEAGALVRIADAAGLGLALRTLLDDPQARERIGAKAREAAESERGATKRAVAEIERRYTESIPRLVPATRAASAPLSRLWLLAAARTPRAERLATPVISVGGLTVGGVGKSPIVLWLAEALKARGRKPAILTRGYKRRAAEPVTIVAPGELVDAARTGDEAQAYVRAAVGPVGIGAHRAAAGRAIEQLFHPDVFILDDGFQHKRLARSLDIVVLDALDPFGGGAAVPLGRLRESEAALARAGAVIVMRTPRGRSIAGLEARIREHNRTVPIFTARVTPRRWIDAATGKPAEPPQRVGAFCGLGNPDSFWRTLRQLGIRPEFRRAFPDHHRYTASELTRMSGVDALLTTQKDAANLPESAFRVLWLEIGVEIDNAEELLRLAQLV